MFSHGWPLSADDWDAQMLFFLNHGFRVIIAICAATADPTQTGDGHDMDHYADKPCGVDRASRFEGCHSRRPFDGSAGRALYLARHIEPRIKAAIISAVRP